MNADLMYELGLISDKTAVSALQAAVFPVSLAAYGYANYKANQELKQKTGQTHYLPMILGTAAGDLAGGIGGSIAGGLVGGLAGALTRRPDLAAKGSLIGAGLGSVGGGIGAGLYGAKYVKDRYLND